ncbi:MAG: amidohydrolase [Candidatus Kapaibacterium sp.]|nr:MAG: amidohydrolase [Candidatus Kapabacteria bacterium]
MLHRLILSLALFFLASSISAQDSADVLLINARIYTVDGRFSVQEAVAIKGGRIAALGTTRDITKSWKAAKTLDAKGKCVYPGFYDAHAHLHSYGQMLQYADLQGTTSYKQVLERLVAYRKANPNGQWILGRGWDQNDWASKSFPTKEPLDSLFPNVPVCLTRIDGHALVANSKALALAGITEETRVEGGLVEKVQGKLTGIVLDNAMDKVYLRINSPTQQEVESAILTAEKRCFAVGLTSVAEAGISHELCETYKKLYAEKRLNMRVYAMLTPTDENVERYLKAGIYQTEYLTVRSFKVMADGALGSRGACLLAPYSDKPTTRGFLTIDSAWMEQFAARISKTPFQINTHCIGDSTNRFILDVYGKYLDIYGKTKRWRIEHAQVVSKKDMSKFREYGIIPSVQPTHCTSDMPWAEERLGKERVKTAYAFKELYEQRGIIALGSDFPVEDINPLYGFHAAVARQDAANKPDGGFQSDQALSRETALRGMTIYAAIAGFEENVKGSLEVGKLADMVILDGDIMTLPANKLRSVNVLQTLSGGRVVFERGQKN